MRPCRTSAKSKMGKSVLAEVLQTPKWGKAPLQKSCKRQNGEKRPCRSPANTKMRKSVLAEVLQTPKWGKASLQEFCKHQNEEKALLQKFCKRQNGKKRSCRSPANAKMGKSTFAETLQSPETSSKCLRESRKSLGKLLVLAGVPQALTLIQYEEWECSLNTVHAKK